MFRVPPRRMRRGRGSCRVRRARVGGGGILGAEVGDFEEGGEVGAGGVGVFAGALEGFSYGLAAGLGVGGESGRSAHRGPLMWVMPRSAMRVVSSPSAVKSGVVGGWVCGSWVHCRIGV